MVKFALNLVDDGLIGQQVFAGEATRLAYMTDEAAEGRDAFLTSAPRLVAVHLALLSGRPAGRAGSGYAVAMKAATVSMWDVSGKRSTTVQRSRV